MNAQVRESGNTKERRRGRNLLVSAWLAAAVLILIDGWRSSRVPLPWSLRLPITPVDLGSARYARFWTFLKEARRALPEGASYTLTAASPEDEMYLFMLSLGIFDRQEALASSYFGVPTPQEGSRARYVVALDRIPPDRLRLWTIARIGEGGVFERGEKGSR